MNNDVIIQVIGVLGNNLALKSVCGWSVSYFVNLVISDIVPDMPKKAHLLDMATYIASDMITRGH